MKCNIEMLTNFNKMLFYMEADFHIVSMHFCRTDNKNKGVMLGISNKKEADFMSGKVTKFMKTQKYRFDFGADGKLYTTIFHGKIPQPELKGMVCSLQNCLYGKTPDVIFSYLKLHHLEFSNFHNMESTLGKDKAMGWAAYLLHSDTYGKMEEILGDADFHYAVVDFQESSPEGYCEGCYYTLSRLPLGDGEFQHNFIGQAYLCHRETCEECGYFAIRKAIGNVLYTIDSSEGKPVLPTFGCVDMAALLAEIETINSKEDAIKTAIK